MLATSDLIAFVGVQDLARARPFYEDILGLPLKAEEGTALVFDANGIVLRVSEVPKPASAKYTVLGWSVDDIATNIQRLTERGVTFARYEGFAQDDLGIWTAPDRTQVAWFEDLDGNLLSLTQF
jgi:catechol 2,3-dioxygenase-like lactoylglutathione lyase family enzyme